MSIVTLSGVVSHMLATSSVSGSKRVHTRHRTDFRVDGVPVHFRNIINIADGDRVVVAGEREGGEFLARAIRNDDTQVIYPSSVNFLIGLGVIMLIIGIPLSLFLIGIPFAIAGAFLVMEGRKNSIALKALQGT